MNDPCASRDLVKKPAAAWLLWGLPIAIILITGNVASAGWILTVAWTASLVTMGVACLVNARGCGRTHCYFTGPFFLLMAIMSLLHGLHVVSLGPRLVLHWHRPTHRQHRALRSPGIDLGSVPLLGVTVSAQKA